MDVAYVFCVSVRVCVFIKLHITAQSGHVKNSMLHGLTPSGGINGKLGPVMSNALCYLE